MFTIGTLVIVGFVALLIGGALGYWLGPLLGSRTPQQKELEEKLAEAEQRFSQYRNQVNRHFEETAKRVNTLTRDYKEVHEHLVNSAIQLADPEAGDQFTDTAQRHLPGSDKGQGDVIDYRADSPANDDPGATQASKDSAEASHEEQGQATAEQETSGASDPNPEKSRK